MPLDLFTETSLLVLREHSSSKYTPRTYYNAQSADLTVAFAVDLSTAGEKCTVKAAKGKHYVGFELHEGLSSLVVARQLYKTMKTNEDRVLNIAGNGIYTFHNKLNRLGLTPEQLQDKVNLFVYMVLNKVHEHLGVSKIYTGGQTGVDIAGAVSGLALKIPTEVTFPKGYIQRYCDGKDVIQTHDTVKQEIHKQCAILEHTIANQMQNRSKSEDYCFMD